MKLTARGASDEARQLIPVLGGHLNMTEETVSPDVHSGYEPKQPLWEPPPRPPARRIAIVGAAVVIILCVLGVVIPWWERQFFSTPPIPVEVSVLGVHGGKSRDEMPAQFVYSVRLPDGGTAVLISRTVHQPGEHLRVAYSMGRLTGRIILSEAARVVSPGL
jgi:hypothetical protein